MSGCYLSVVRLDHHLKRVHHITKKDLINTAVNTVDLSTPSLLLNLPVDNAFASQISEAICGQSQCIVENPHSFVKILFLKRYKIVVILMNSLMLFKDI